MADTDDYLSVYKKFFDDFAATVNPDDQLPVRVAGYFLREDEIVGEIVDWTLQYLNQKNCPAGLTAPIARQVLDEVRAASKKDPDSCGFVHSKHAYDPLRLMHAVVRVVNEVCGRYCDNGRVLQLPRPRPGPPISTCAIRNSRRLMEDRHVIVHDLHAVFGIPDPSPASYYAVFDGHAGTDAAIYGVSHLHQFLAESPFYPKDPVRALKDAFRRTDQLFIEKSHIENLRSGTTVVCALIRPEEKKLYVAWLGDSQALLVRRERMMLLVNPHKPDRPDERERIEKMGGCVMYFGTWRVNGQLAVSRAIGDSEYKPYVCAEPDVTELSLDGTEDFLVLACDGLWDFVTEQQVAAAVYLHLHEHPDDVSGLSEQLVCLSKEQGSTDNISVIVALLRPARDMDMGGGALLHPPESLRGHERRDQQHHQHEHDHDDDLGPETSVDDGELQRQSCPTWTRPQSRARRPTPPAASLLPGQCEPDNVADSGEDSEDEWNYYKIEPTEKAVNVESLVQTKQPVCPESTQLNLEEKPEDIFDMESRLNPDAKEFVPSPTHSKPSFEDTIISHSPSGKILPFDNVEVPSMAQFQQEIRLRPGEVSEEDALSNSAYLPDIQSDILNGGSVMDDIIKKKYGESEFKLTEQNLAAFTSNNPFEVSEVSSTKAVYGDESAASFTTSTSDILQKNLGTSASNVEGSFVETDFVASETSSVKQSEDFLGFEASREFTEFKKGLDDSLPTDFSPAKETGAISFELQKDIAPTMEECPERVKLTDDLINPFSHEQPIAEMPMEESEQITENERTDLLNESFEHGPDFTLEEYELSSPLNPCAPVFDYKNMEDNTDVPKAGEANENVDIVEQKPTEVSSDLASGAPISQIISSESPIELLDTVKTELTELDKDTLSSEHDRALLAEADSKLAESSSCEQLEEYLSKSSQNEKSEKDLFLHYSDESLNFNQPSTEIAEKPNFMENSVKLEEEIHEKQSDHMVDTEFLDEVHETRSDLMKEFENRTMELNEPFSTEGEVLQNPNLDPLEELRKDAAEPLEELRKDAAEPLEELRKDAAEPLEELRKDAAEPLEELRKDAAEPLEELRKDAAEPLEELRKDAAEPLEELRKDAAEPLEELRKDAAEPLEELRKDAAEPLEELRKDAAEPLEELRKDAAEPLEELRKDAAEPLEELRKDAAEPLEELRKDAAEPLEELRKDAAEPLEELRKDAAEPLEELRKDAAEPLEELRKDAAEPAKVVDELHGEDHDLMEDVNEAGDTKVENLDTITGLTDIRDIETASFQKDTMKLNAVESPELNNEIHTVQSITLENRLSFETASPPAEAVQNQEPSPSAEQTIGDICVPDLHGVPEALRVCVYPMPVEQSSMKDDVELISPSFESQEEKREALEKDNIHGTDFSTALKLESLSGEQRDMIETMLNEVSNKTELEELNDLTSNADKDVVLEELQSQLNYVGIETGIAEKTEETAEKTIEKKDISIVEQTTEKPEALDEKAVSDETLKLSDADFSDDKNISGTAAEKGEPDKEAHKTGDGEDEVLMITKTPPPTPTPASQTELTKDALEMKSESTVSAVAVASAAVAGAAATTTAITSRKEPALKKQTPLSKDVKKTPVAKDSDKMKPSTKAPVKQSPGTAKAPTKTSPTSPTKASVPSTPRTSTPKRTQVAPSAAKTTAKTTTTTTTSAKSLSRPTSNVPSKPTSLATQKQSSTTTGKVPTSSIAPKPSLKAALSSTTKPSQTVRAASAPKPRVPSATTTTATKNPLTNGDVKSAEVKKTSVATSKIAPRTHTAPSRTTTVSKSAGTTTAASVPKTGVQARTSLTTRPGMTNGIAQKPRVTSSTTQSQRSTTNHQTATEKQHKETANKHISSRRIGTAPSKTSPAKVGVKKSPQTAKGGKTPPTANGSPLISTGTGEEKKKDPLL
ncbi:LOW QUALITY PROTEIN: calponin homology domain-containing protein DDB_G0272472-like [Schistocerca cancellata]|uniref:LOW QUALITY PROTEIN: calponin homology domain-containing protein DDB_G0272472-like n=1 Tax=Schistocerca cancellata TaxID=274614 RepID=UPI0021172CB2|nr:LOW QUALITY PROTEIN: calponin homology domain-containing protein DDB_G0272472-like [Schistocerca cancellata]